MRNLKWMYHHFWFMFHYQNCMDKYMIERNYKRMFYHHEKLLELEGK